MKLRTTAVGKACLAGLLMLMTSAWDQPRWTTHAVPTLVAQADQAVPALPEAVRQRGTLRVATYAGYPPLTFRAEGTNEIVGMEIELARTIAAELGVGVTFFDTPFEAIIPGLLARRFDLAITDMSDTPARQQQVNFIDYAKAFSTIVVPKGNPGRVFSLDDLCGKPVATQTASSQFRLLTEQAAKCVAAGKDAVQIFQVPDAAQVDLNLRTGRSVAQIRDFVLGRYQAEHSNGQLEIVSTPSGPAQVGAPDLVGIAVIKGDQELVAALRQALERIIADGRYAAILRKYDLQFVAVDHVTVNGRRD